MRGKLLIPICLFIACQLFYDLYAMPFNTRWTIFYFNAQYFSWLVLVVLLMKCINRHNYKLWCKSMIPHITLSIGLIIYMAIEFRYWNYTYTEYYAHVNEFKQYILPIAAILTGLTYYLVKK